MKECPVCKTFVFDDMGVCYGCMHCFPEDEAGVSLQNLLPEIVIGEVGEAEENRGGNTPAGGGKACASEPDGLVGAVDTAGVDGFLSEGWILRVEMRDPRMSNRFWTMELTPSSKTG